MFGQLTARVERAAQRRVEKLRIALAERIADDFPGGVAAEVDKEGVRVKGRGLARRFALDPALRWLLTGLRR